MTESRAFPGHSRRSETTTPIYSVVLYRGITDMDARDYPERQGRKIWLDQDEVVLFLEQATTKQQEIAFHLMARSGLRSNEVIEVRRLTVVNTPPGP